MNKKKTIIYGGAFNPPTVAHEQILQACVDYAIKINADIWVMPSGDRADKKINNDKSRRIDLINAMIDDIDKKGIEITIFTIELDRKILVHTIDTVLQLARLYPDRSFEWVFGYDSTVTMSVWDGGKWMLDNLQTIVIKRPGSVINPNLKHFIELDIEPSSTSSTEVRRRLELGEPIDDLVGKLVQKYLAV